MKIKKLMTTVFLTFAMLLLVNGQPIIKGPTWSFAALEDEKVEGIVSGDVQEGVSIRLTKVVYGETSSEFTETDANGYFKFSDLLNGNYTVTPEKNGYIFSPKSISIIIPNNAAKNIDFSATCIPATECTEGFNCGTEDDGCDGTIDCGTCEADEICTDNICLPNLDIDSDGVPNDVDNCPNTFNPDQEDADNDDLGDACDDCLDVDDDGVCDDIDNCIGTPNPGQEDADNDTLGDVCDDCPNDFNNDADSDGLCGDIDNCPNISNFGQEDTDNDGIGDACDDCLDVDNDGVCDDVDNCPGNCNTQQLDADGDGMGDVCDSDPGCGGGYGQPECEKPCAYPGNNYCRDNGPCTEGIGDCDKDLECASGLICVQDVGTDYGWPLNVDVCEQVDEYPGDNYCALYGPCKEGIGDCDEDSQCASGLKCVNDVGADYGWPSNVDVCEQVSCGGL
jgi:hypothetical protein